MVSFLTLLVYLYLLGVVLMTAVCLHDFRISKRGWLSKEEDPHTLLTRGLDKVKVYVPMIGAWPAVILCLILTELYDRGYFNWLRRSQKPPN